MFNHAYPYTDAHELNLDWIIKVVTDNETQVKELTVKFEGIVTQFETLSHSVEDLNAAFEQFKTDILNTILTVASQEASRVITEYVESVVFTDKIKVVINDTIKIATVDVAGIVKPDDTTIKIDSEGVLSVVTATDDTVGLVKPDGKSIIIDNDGVLSVIGEYPPIGSVTWETIANKPTTFTPPIATDTVLGGVKIGDGINISDDGTISAIGGSGDLTIIANTWNNTTTYNADTYVIHNNKLWKCLQTNSNTEPPNSVYWLETKVGNELGIINIKKYNVGMVKKTNVALGNIEKTYTNNVSGYNFDISSWGITNAYLKLTFTNRVGRILLRNLCILTNSDGDNNLSTFNMCVSLGSARISGTAFDNTSSDIKCYRSSNSQQIVICIPFNNKIVNGEIYINANQLRDINFYENNVLFDCVNVLPTDLVELPTHKSINSYN